MERDIQIFEEQGRVEITFRGPVSFVDRIKVMEEVFPQLVAHGLTRILVDYSAAWVHAPSPKTFEALESKLRSEPFLEQCRIALVNPPEFHAVPTESIESEIGYSVRRFNSHRAALAWLEGDAR